MNRVARSVTPLESPHSPKRLRSLSPAEEAGRQNSAYLKLIEELRTNASRDTVSRTVSSAAAESTLEQIADARLSADTRAELALDIFKTGAWRDTPHGGDPERLVESLVPLVRERGATPVTRLTLATHLLTTSRNAQQRRELGTVIAPLVRHRDISALQAGLVACHLLQATRGRPGAQASATRLRRAPYLKLAAAALPLTEHVPEQQQRIASLVLDALDSTTGTSELPQATHDALLQAVTALGRPADAASAIGAMLDGRLRPSTAALERFIADTASATPASPVPTLGFPRAFTPLEVELVKLDTPLQAELRALIFAHAADRTARQLADLPSIGLTRKSVRLQPRLLELATDGEVDVARRIALIRETLRALQDAKLPFHSALHPYHAAAIDRLVDDEALPLTAKLPAVTQWLSMLTMEQVALPRHERSAHASRIAEWYATQPMPAADVEAANIGRMLLSLANRGSLKLPPEIWRGVFDNVVRAARSTEGWVSRGIVAELHRAERSESS